MNKKKLWKMTAVFFAFMLCFTMLSRAADQRSVAVVTAVRPENRMLTHEVRAAGRVVQNQELAVTTEPDQRVKAIYVGEGERVKKGELLFEVDLTLLEEKILMQQQEMEKQQLTVGDAKSQKDVSAQQKASQQAQAAEQYSLSTHSADVQLSRAKETLSEAKKELQEFRKQQGTVPEENKVEESLLQTCEEKTDAYIQAQQELSQLQWEIEAAVHTALQNAQSRASLVSGQRVYTQASADEPEVIAPQPGETEPTALQAEEPEPIVPQPEDPELIVPQPEEPESTAPQPEEGQDAQGDFTIDSITEVPGDSILEESDPEGDFLLPEDDTDAGGGGNSSGSAEISPEELDRIEQSVRSQYSQALLAANQKAASALAEQEAAEAALAAYQEERMKAAGAQNAQSEKQLLEQVRAAQQAYEDAAIAANEAAVTSGRAVQQAGIPDPRNSSDRMNEITYEQMELQLEKLEQLKQNEGKVTAPADGLITGISVRTGEKTTDTTALLMADLSKGYRFTAELTKEQAEQIGTGDLVTLQGSAKKQVLEDLPVESVTADEQNESLYRVNVQIPRDSEVFELGAGATLRFERKSEAYPLCVPLSALRLDEKNQTYVLVAEPYESVLGTETRARRINVTVLEKNESYAALAEGALDAQQQVIVRSEKAVDEGSRVRLQE